MFTVRVFSFSRSAKPASIRTVSMASEANKVKKRPLEQDVSELQLSKEARVRGCLTSLSPIKKSAAGKFEGQLSSCRVVGFDPHVHQKLQTFHGGEDALVLGNCHVKEGGRVQVWK